MLWLWFYGRVEFHYCNDVSQNMTLDLPDDDILEIRFPQQSFLPAFSATILWKYSALRIRSESLQKRFSAPMKS